MSWRVRGESVVRRASSRSSMKTGADGFGAVELGVMRATLYPACDWVDLARGAPRGGATRRQGAASS